MKRLLPTEGERFLAVEIDRQRLPVLVLVDGGLTVDGVSAIGFHRGPAGGVVLGCCPSAARPGWYDRRIGLAIDCSMSRCAVRSC